jgi:hypothetical protein
VLRVETTIHDASGLKVYRPVGDDPAGELNAENRDRVTCLFRTQFPAQTGRFPPGFFGL